MGEAKALVESAGGGRVEVAAGDAVLTMKGSGDVSLSASNKLTLEAAQIEISGYSGPVVGFSPSLPWARSVTSFGFVNNFSKTLANHIVRFGIDFRRERNESQKARQPCEPAGVPVQDRVPGQPGKGGAGQPGAPPVGEDFRLAQQDGDGDRPGCGSEDGQERGT